MTIGLNVKELNELLLFGKTAQEIGDNIAEGLDKNADTTSFVLSAICLLQEKVMVAILENNKRINEQLISAGLQV